MGDCLPSSLQVIVTGKTDTKEALLLKQQLHRKAGPGIRVLIQEYLRCLKEGIVQRPRILCRASVMFAPWCTEYSRDLILPKRDSSPAQVHRENSVPNTAATPNKALTAPTVNSASKGSG